MSVGMEMGSALGKGVGAGVFCRLGMAPKAQHSPLPKTNKYKQTNFREMTVLAALGSLWPTEAHKTIEPSGQEFSMNLCLTASPSVPMIWGLPGLPYSQPYTEVLFFVEKWEWRVFSKAKSLGNSPFRRPFLSND